MAAVTEMPCEGRDILTDTESDSGSSCNESSDCLETEIVTNLAEMAYSDATFSTWNFYTWNKSVT